MKNYINPIYTFGIMVFLLPITLMLATLILPIPEQHQQPEAPIQKAK